MLPCTLYGAFLTKVPLELGVTRVGPAFGLSINRILTSFSYLLKKRRSWVFIFLFIPQFAKYMTKGNKDYFNVAALKRYVLTVCYLAEYLQVFVELGD